MSLCYCYKDYFSNLCDEKDGSNQVFIQGRYYKYLGASEMRGEYNKIVGFGKLENWQKYFLTPSQDRERKINEILEN